MRLLVQYRTPANYLASRDVSAISPIARLSPLRTASGWHRRSRRRWVGLLRRGNPTTGEKVCSSATYLGNVSVGDLQKGFKISGWDPLIRELKMRLFTAAFVSFFALSLALPSQAKSNSWEKAWCNSAGGCFYVRVINKKNYPTVIYEIKGSPSTGSTTTDTLKIDCLKMTEKSITHGYSLDLNSANVNPVHLEKARIVCR